MLKETILEVEEEINRLNFLLIGCTDEARRQVIRGQIEEYEADLKALRNQVSSS